MAISVKLLPLFKYKKCGEYYKNKPDKIVPPEFFPEIPDGKAAKYDKCNYFLYGFKLCCAINLMPDSVCGNLKTIFKKCYPPTDKYHCPKYCVFVL